MSTKVVKLGVVGLDRGADRKMLADFVSRVAENRRPKLDVNFAINMALPGILAHESAIRGGAPMEIPQF